YWRRGPITMAAIGAVDTALWDIRGKSLDTPVYQLLGGASRDAVLVYGHANGATIEETVAAVARYVKLGYTAVRAQCGIPGLAQAYGVGRGDRYYEPAEQGMPPEHLWSSERYLGFVPTLFTRLRAEFGDELHFLHDVHHRLTPIEAARLGKALEPYHLFWLEDPVPAELQEGFRLIRQHTTTPLAVGEVFNTVYDSIGSSRNSSSITSAPPSCTRAGSATCGRSPRSPSCITCAPAATAPPISARSAWRRRCTST